MCYIDDISEKHNELYITDLLLSCVKRDFQSYQNDESKLKAFTNIPYKMECKTYQK